MWKQVPRELWFEVALNGSPIDARALFSAVGLRFPHDRPEPLLQSEMPQLTPAQCAWCTDPDAVNRSSLSNCLLRTVTEISPGCPYPLSGILTPKLTMDQYDWLCRVSPELVTAQALSLGGCLDVFQGIEARGVAARHLVDIDLAAEGGHLPLLIWANIPFETPVLAFAIMSRDRPTIDYCITFCSTGNFHNTHDTCFRIGVAMGLVADPDIYLGVTSQLPWLGTNGCRFYLGFALGLLTPPGELRPQAEELFSQHCVSHPLASRTALLMVGRLDWMQKFAFLFASPPGDVYYLPYGEYYIAAMRGHMDVVRWLDSSPMAWGEGRGRAVVAAGQLGNFELVDSLLAEGYPLSSPLWTAATTHNNRALICRLRDAGIPPHQYALDGAVWASDPELVNELLEMHPGFYRYPFSDNCRNTPHATDASRRRIVDCICDKLGITAIPYVVTLQRGFYDLARRRLETGERIPMALFCELAPIELFEWLTENHRGVPLREYLVKAAELGRIDVANWALREMGRVRIPEKLEGKVLSGAGNGGHLKFMEWALDHGARWWPGMGITGEDHMKKWLLEHGCPPSLLRDPAPLFWRPSPEVFLSRWPTFSEKVSYPGDLDLGNFFDP